MDKISSVSTLTLDTVVQTDFIDFKLNFINGKMIDMFYKLEKNIKPLKLL